MYHLQPLINEVAEVVNNLEEHTVQQLSRVRYTRGQLLLAAINRDIPACSGESMVCVAWAGGLGEGQIYTWEKVLLCGARCMYMQGRAMEPELFVHVQLGGRTAMEPAGETRSVNK